MVGVCGATGTTQLNPSTNPPHSGASNVSRATGPASSTSLPASHVRVSRNAGTSPQPERGIVVVATGTTRNAVTAGTSGSGTSSVPGNRDLGVTTVGASSHTGTARSPVIAGSGTSNVRGSTDLGVTTTGVSSHTGATVSQGAAGTRQSGTSGTPVNSPPGAANGGAASPAGSTSTSVRNQQASGATTSASAAHHGQPSGALPSVPPRAGTSNRPPKETGSSGAPAPSLLTNHTAPAVGKPGSPPPSPLNQNMTAARPTSQRLESAISSATPLNDARLVRRPPKRGNEGIYLSVSEQDIPFFPGPLNEPPLSVFVFGMQPGLPTRAPRLPGILRMPPAELTG